MNRWLLVLLAIASAAFSWSTAAWAHGEATRIVPVSLSVKAGSKLEVTVNGLIGTDTATYKLTGISGKYDLGQFPIRRPDQQQPAQTDDQQSCEHGHREMPATGHELPPRRDRSPRSGW